MKEKIKNVYVGQGLAPAAKIGNDITQGDGSLV